MPVAQVRALLVAAGTPEPDALVDVLLAPLAPEVYGYQRTVLGLTPGQITASLAPGVLVNVELVNARAPRR